VLGYYYNIIDTKGKENVVVDALSRQFEEDGSLFALSLPVLGWLMEAYQEWMENDTTIQLIERFHEDPKSPKGYTGKIHLCVKVAFF
jgi:hypothetical protein